MATTKPDRLYFTGNDEADELIAREPLALLIGFVLDQQVPLQKAFSSPLELKKRLGGTLDAADIAGRDPGELEEIFRAKPALHRFPGTMAHRTQELCAAVASEYDGDAERVWADAESGQELRQRLLDLPGIGDMKVRSLIAILGKRFGFKPPGWDEVAPTHPTLGDIDSPETLQRYQDAKRAYKAKLRSERSAPTSDP
ncbi:MAG TPA: HhH-GPD-type base excision DNA repair protein [Gaiellaceae bacterium]